ncbi:hypothetical protein C6A87_002500 [Mycobacterium sp. ITM-2016-00317]|uniref:hypothetical protein n=1 Tax=Mycobacterium sp. ITM-2016-00317 TaxID=2099694 RepID=UPI00287F6CAD|nr:hypothetical protein [Mycobacterium sp. ITM-2016-00317]WNG88152.1 hypothetical protein C6A87_002500 [Mycobacterium sp. ITM-2016-00317]
MYVVTGGGLGQPPGASTDCSAVSVDRFDKQPAELKRVVSASFAKPAEWFDGLDRDIRVALTAIFNRLCRYGVWPQVRRIVKVTAGEAPFMVADRALRVPGVTPAVYFAAHSGDALITALMATGRFCMAQGAGASLHKGQTTLREISKSDSLHISVGSPRSRDEFDAHIDLYSPTPEHTGSSFCSNRPSVAAVAHIGREVVPEGFRKLTGIPGVQVFPEPAAPPPVPPSPRQDPGTSDVLRLTWRGGRTAQRPRTPNPAGALLPVDVVTRVERAVKAQVSPEALLPSHVRVRLTRTRRALETAGPTEEDAARYARDTAEQEAQTYPDAQVLALSLAEQLEQARRANSSFVKVVLPQYGSGDFGSRKAIAGEIRRIALTVRKFLPGRAQGVRTIVIVYGTGTATTRVDVQLP